MLNLLITNLLLPLAVDAVKAYVKNSDSKNDDKVLELSKVGVEYLADKTNNDVAKKISQELNNSTMKKIQKER